MRYTNKMDSTIVGRLLSFDPVIKPIIDNLPAGYWFFI
jgi:hypothetical protein